MFAKYLTLWTEQSAKYGSKTALLYQVGSFFEIYDTENLTTGRTQANIREIADICQLSLSVHEVEGDRQTLFGGFPDHALPKFEKILVGAGYTVVVVTQRKGRGGLVEERLIEHIASPGLYVDGSVKERRLVGIVLETMGAKVYWATAALDLATGRIWFVESVTGGADRLHQFLCLHPPAELVIWSDGSTSSLTDSLKTVCSAVHVRCLAPASQALEEATLSKHWLLSRLDWIHTFPQARRCLAALMDFAADHLPSALRVLDEPEAWIPDGEVRLGNAALEQLGLLSLRSEKQSLLGLMDQCRSVAGRRLMRARLMRPISDPAVLERRYDAIDAIYTSGRSHETERGLRSLYDMSRLWRKLELGTAGFNDMACLLRSYEAAATLIKGSTPEAGWLTEVAARWSMTATVAAARDGVSVPVAALPWHPAAVDPMVGALFAEGLAIRDQAVALCTSWSESGTLAFDDAEGGGFRVTGTKRRISAVIAKLRDEGDMSAKTMPFKTTALIETAGLEALTTKHRAWMHRWTPVWHSAWSDALARLVQGKEVHVAIETWCAELDLSWTLAGLAKEWNWKRPILLEDATESKVSVIGLRHPILERLTTTPYVAHSFIFDQSQRGLLLYGMNASGKSSLMKALGLSVLLAQCGFPVPATELRLVPFTAIFTRILGNDNLWAGLSSFAVEMTEFREILRFADERSLVLGDELCSGTESLSATALVAAGVETLADRGTKFIFATHLHELAALPSIVGISSVKAAHLKVRYEAATDRLIYDRELAAGSGSALYGLEVCRALDLPLDYLDRAMSLRKELAGWKAPTQSAWNPSVAMGCCTVCAGLQGLETHHIRHREDGGGDEVSNLVCLCTVCHDDHHAGRLRIIGWEDTSAGRQLRWSRPSVAEQETGEEVLAWIREQRQLKIRIPTIQRMAKQIFGASLTEKMIRGCR